MISLYYGGSEVSSWRTLLNQSGIEHVALSYMGLRRRTKFTRPWTLNDKYPAHQKILLDSGCHTLNKDRTKYTDEDIVAFTDHYYAWAEENLDRLDMVTEFDSLQLGHTWIKEMRQAFGSFFGDKFTPIWHPEHGLGELNTLAASYKRVGVPQAALGARDLTPVLNGLVRTHGTRLHGMAMTKPDVMRDCRFATVSSTSWLSPSQFGDTIIWVGNTLKRYPMPYKTKARTRHYRQIQAAGFDADKILADNPTEVLKLSLWSWERTMDDINRHKAATTSPFTPEAANTESPLDPVAPHTPETRHQTIPREHRRSLPFLAKTTKTETYTDDSGVRQQRQIEVIDTSSKSLRNCNSCYISAVCDAFQPDSECVYEIPISLNSKMARDATYDAVEKILLERFFLGYAMEQANGGYLDANVSAEADRLGRFIKLRAEAEQDRFTAKIEVSQQGNLGMISRIFGPSEGERARELPAPIPVNSALADLGVIDAEVIEEDPAFNA